MNLPNKLTVLRIILIAVFAVFFLVEAIPYNYVIAAAVFAIAAFTDFLDGYLARKLNLVTNLGKFLDPIADKILVSTALIFLVSVHGVMIPVFGEICVAVIIARELMISALRQIAAARGIVMAADKSGKIKTFVQDICILLLIISCQFTSYGFFVYLYYTCAALLGVATLLTIYSAVHYLVANKEVLRN